MDNPRPNKCLSRRRFVSLAVVAAGAGLGGLLAARPAASQELPRLKESDPAAQGLRYVHDASRVDTRTRGGADRKCSNCRFYGGGSESEWGPCSLFPGKAVSADGWCTAWAARTG